MNFNLFFKNFIILILIILIFLNIYFGIFLTFKKSVYLIDGLRLLQTGRIQTIDEFTKVFLKVLELKSYVGQEEVVKVVGQYILNVVNNKNIEKEEVKKLIDFIEPYFLEKEYFHNFIQGQLYFIYYLKSNDEVYLQKAEEIYSKMIKNSPNLPLPYLSLYDLYFQTKQFEKAKIIGEKILNYWPNYKEIREKLDSLK